MTKVSRRLPHARIIAVEIFRGPDHIAMRTVGFTRKDSRAAGELASEKRFSVHELAANSSGLALRKNAEQRPARRDL